ncbi:hypothetical protein LTR86_005348 [Recurvomyces mirabilis]|nr:hypothetical protein LTR86_005348 [Recurvomyces mirabilis]
MSGIEVVGLLLGAFPLAISAVEHYRDTAKTAGTFWRIRKAYTKDVNSVKYCRTILVLHMEELLGPLVDDDITNNLSKCAALLQDVGGKGWRQVGITNPLEDRLQNAYEAYLETMQELNTLMVNLNEDMKVEDPRFQRLVDKESKSKTAVSLKSRTQSAAKTVAFQGPRLLYSLDFTRREEILTEVQLYIKRLQDLLTSVDRIHGTVPERPRTRLSATSKPLLRFWRHAERIYRLITTHMKCQCDTHSARLWLRQESQAEANLRLHLMFSQDHAVLQGPWKQPSLRLHHVEGPDLKTVTIHNAKGPTVRLVVPSSRLGVKIHPSQSSAPRSTAAASLPAQIEPLRDGLCMALSQDLCGPLCLGDLHDIHDELHYRLFRDMGQDPIAITVSASTTILPGFQPSFYRLHRFALAVELALAQLRYHTTPWLPDTWSLENIHFRLSPAAVPAVDYQTAHIISSLGSGQAGSDAQQTADHSFWSMGIVLLELCFGRRLESHYLWKDTSIPRNSKDLLHRLTVAQQWAKDVEFEAGSQYASAVKWCLHEAPAGTTSHDWRTEFAGKVLQPLQQCYESAKPSIVT